MNQSQKIDIVRGVVNAWEKNGDKVTVTSSWFIEAIDAFYSEETANMNLAETMSLLATTGNVFKKNQDKIEKSMSKISYDEEAIWAYCMNRWEYYDEIEGGYSGDKYTQNVFNDAGNRYGISASKAEAIWDKVDRAKYGLD